MRAMSEAAASRPGEAVTAQLYVPGRVRPAADLFGRDDLTAQDVAQIEELMRALGEVREVEEAIRRDSEAYMRLSAQDMRALHYLIVAGRTGTIVTPGMLAAHMGISPTSTTKLLNRLERGGHIVRRLHPADRRAFAIEVTPSTVEAARQTIGRRHARRARAAARLSPAEREVVTRFLRDMAAEISSEEPA